MEKTTHPRAWQAFSPPQGGRLHFLLLIALIAVCFLGGGASRADTLSLLYVRPFAVIALSIFLFVPNGRSLRAVRWPLLLLGLFALLMALQIIPLPPGLWGALPGRTLFLEAATIAGLPQPWRPISIAPDLTLNSLVAMVVPLAALVGFARLDRNQQALMVPILIVASLASAALGIVQLTGGSESSFYPYAVTNNGSAVGLMSNRNHQALLLAVTYPMLAVWASTPQKDPQVRWFRMLSAAAVGFFLVPMILVTGSRAGLVLGGASAFIACLFFMNEQRIVFGELSGNWRKMALALGFASGVMGLFATFAFSRAEALQRLLTLDAEQDVRMTSIDTFLAMARDFFPFGAGAGTFDPLYRVYEPHQALAPTYLNQAHNDLADLVITGGVVALVLLGLFVVWWSIMAGRAFLGAAGNIVDARLARMGSMIILIMLIASLVDYPLRTPALAAVFAICCGWLSLVGSAARKAASANG